MTRTIQISKVFCFLLVNLVVSTGICFSQDIESYNNRELDISFAYPNNWRIGTPIEKHTKFVVNWTTLKSKSLLTTCSIFAAPHEHSEKLSRNLSKYYDQLVADFWNKRRSRYDDVEVISTKLSKIDGKDVIFYSHNVSQQSLEKKSNFRIYTVQTFWKGNEIGLECGTEMFDVDFGKYSKEQKERIISMQNLIETKIMRILSSLHFDRTG